MLNLKTFQQALADICPAYLDKKFLLTVSGGGDSMVMLHLFKAAELKFEVAHVNYRLRESESEKDRELVERLCGSENIPFHIYEVSQKDDQPKNSIQEWARNLRCTFFQRIKSEQNLDFIVTAHHLNDQLETFLINLSKASGIKGLSAIPSHKNEILRPLLNFSKEEIYDFADLNHIEFREDLSNQKNDYLRNKIRNMVVPNLVEINENFLENFGKSISYLRQTADFVEEQILKIEKETIILKDSYFHIKKEIFLRQTDFVQFEILRKFGFTEAGEVRKIAKAEVGKKFISRDFQLTVDREFLVIGKLKTPEIESEEIMLTMDADNKITIPEHVREGILDSGTFNWKVDAKKIFLPLKLRRKAEGDVFHPIGMIGKKKISKFFKDEKIPIFAQQKIWLLCDGNDTVLGILPYRQDRRFTPDERSTEIINVKLGNTDLPESR